MDATQSAQVHALLCRPHSATPSTALPRAALRLAAPAHAPNAWRAEPARMPRICTDSCSAVQAPQRKAVQRFALPHTQAGRT